MTKYILFLCFLVSTAVFADQVEKQGIYSLVIYGDYDEHLSHNTFRVFKHDSQYFQLENNNNHVGLRLLQGSEFFDSDFSAALNKELTKAYFPEALRYPFNGESNPGLAIAFQYTGCNELTGRFKVLELVKDEQGKVVKFAADFEHHCEKQSSQFFGAIRYNSSYPAVTNQAKLEKGQLTIPLVEIRSEFGVPYYRSLVLNEVAPSQYQVTKILPVASSEKENFDLPVAFDLKNNRFVLPSVLSEKVEYEFHFFDLPNDLKTGEILILDKKIPLRQEKL